MGKLTMTKQPEKAAVNNAGSKALGVEIGIAQITKAEPFASLYAIKPEVLEAIKQDMAEHGFDPSKPVNVWRTPEGERILIDGYTRLKAAEALGFMHVTAYEKTFTDESEALTYAIHTQRDRRNLSEAEILHLVELVDKPQKGFKTALPSTIASNAAIEKKPLRSSESTAAAVGISRAKVERARTVLSDPIQKEAVQKGEKTINRAEQDSRKKNKLSTTKPAAKRHKTAIESIAPMDQIRNEIRSILKESESNKSDRAAGYRQGMASALKIVEKYMGQ